MVPIPDYAKTNDPGDVANFDPGAIISAILVERY